MYYYSVNSFLRERYGEKIYKLALDGGFTCPNRDGSLDTRGCIFCAGGSGDFAVPLGEDAAAAIENAKAVVSGKGGKKFIAYFQSYTATYASVEKLRSLYMPVVMNKDVVILDLATRPDCLGEDVVRLLTEINCIKPVWVELGLQTIHPATARYIRRGYDLPVYDEAVRALKAAGLTVITHMILGLPGETPGMMRQTAEYIGRSGSDGIKFQLLHVLRGTDLALDYAAGLFKTLTMEEYIACLEECVESIPRNMVIHRLTGDGAKRSLLAPLWSADKKRVLNAVNAAFLRDDVQQGRKR